MKRANNIHYDYFDSIDTEYKAYILGFIYADGTIELCKGNREKRLRISIQEEDGYILEKLISDVNGNKVTTKNSLSLLKNKWKQQKSISISSSQICDSLIKMGCIPNKSRDGIRFPIIEKEFIPHFIRGFFDGDGCINIKKKKYKGKTKESVYFSKRIAFTSTDKQFLEDLISHLPIQKIYRSGRQRTLFVHNYWIERVGDIEAVKAYMYNNATYYLQRKYDKFNMTIESQAEDTSSEGLTTT